MLKYSMQGGSGITCSFVLRHSGGGVGGGVGVGGGELGANILYRYARGTAMACQDRRTF